MEEQIGLSVNELAQIFAQIKKTDDRNLGDKIYAAYLPLVSKFAKQYHLKEEAVTDTYTEVFVYVFENTISGLINADSFDRCVKNIMTNKCIKLKKNQTMFKSEMLGMTYEKNMEYKESEETRKAKNDEFVSQSFLFVTQVLTQLKENPELAQEKGLDAEKISMLEDYYGINSEHKRYKVQDIAVKYNVTESRATALLTRALKAFRDMKEFQPIKARLHRG